MSRNIRIKIPRTPVKIAKRRLSDSSDSSSLNLSDDDGYSGVEDVSESDEDDEERVYAAEEDHIITNALRKQAPPRPVEESDDADEEDGDEEDEEDDDDDAEEEDDAADEHASWDGILTDPEDNVVEQPASYFDQAAEVEKHVRFTGVPDSDSESTTTEDDINDFFPDIFVAQNSLDPAFRKEIENDDNSSNSGSFWDFQSGSQEFYEVDSDNERIAQVSEDTTPTVTPMASHPPTEASTPVVLFHNDSDFDDLDELDGYESDGETTEEEDISEPLIRRKQIRRPQSVELTSESETERATPSRPGKPHTGKFKLDTDNKPMAVLNPLTRKMMIFTPQRNNRLDLSPESFNLSLPQPDLAGCAPILSNPGYLMMGAMLSHNTFGDFMNTQPFGPAEAFFPLTSDALTEDSDYSELAEEDEEESKLEIEDFITFHQDSSDREDAPANDYFGEAASSPTRPTTAASGVSAATDAGADADASGDVLHPLLNHFNNNSNAVGAFRRNQINQLTLSKKMSEESREFGSLYSDGPVCGAIKSTCLEAVNALMTPGRKKKRSNTVAGFADTSPAPLSQKRKASNYMDATHKRHRSISDMESMHI
ncbi:hypothetical protein QBC37DRAFT_37530 [Rhypophila decipiens]|uniref:Uncharacterized protein n=1 Tax=Rhypophila decipiens TaxID=261697 RepID=A0AAN6Y500_9PEZI|nr:hypothetical protein QBC37DRAFT_37530 [Rhypophila decipiens]